MRSARPRVVSINEDERLSQYAEWQQVVWPERKPGMFNDWWDVLDFLLKCGILYVLAWLGYDTLRAWIFGR